MKISHITLCVVLIAASFACKTSRHRSDATTPGPSTVPKDSAAGNRTVETKKAVVPLDLPTFVVTSDGESVIAIDPQDRRDFEDQVAERNASLARNGITPQNPPEDTGSGTDTDVSEADLTQKPIDPTQASDHVIETMGIVLGSFAAGGAAVGGVFYVRAAMNHVGGPVSYFLKPFSKPYFYINLYLSEKKILKGGKPAYNVIIEDYGKPIELDGRTFHIVESSPLHGRSDLTGRKAYLGVLPTESVVSGEIADFQRANTGKPAKGKKAWTQVVVPNWDQVRAVSMVEHFETKEMSRRVEYSHVPTPDNDPVSLGKLREAASFQAEAVLAGKDVYVHCKSGVGRSAEAIAVHLMDTYGMTAEEAGKYVRQRRPIVRVGEPHVHQRAIQNYELFRLNMDKVKSDDIERKYKKYKIDDRRLHEINEARRNAGKRPLPDVKFRFRK